MKQFLLFAGNEYYPAGGWSDFIESFGSVEEAIKYYADSDLNDSLTWYHIVDINNGCQIIAGKELPS